MPLFDCSAEISFTVRLAVCFTILLYPIFCFHTTTSLYLDVSVQTTKSCAGPLALRYHLAALHSSYPFKTTP